MNKQLSNTELFHPWTTKGIIILIRVLNIGYVVVEVHIGAGAALTAQHNLIFNKRKKMGRFSVKTILFLWIAHLNILSKTYTADYEVTLKFILWL